MVVGFTTSYAISGYHQYVESSNPAHSEVYSIQHYEIKFLRVLWFPPPIKLTATIKIRAIALRCLREILRHQPRRFCDYAELTTLRILEAHKDQTPTDD
jgi:hypothetical protein